MEKENATDRDLFLALDRKIDEVKHEISNLHQKDIANNDKLTHLNDRLEYGVSKTANSAVQKISDLALKLNDLEHSMVAQNETIKNHEKILSRFMTGIFWMSFAGVLGGLIGLVYKLLESRITGG